jgi:predicted ATPase
MLETTRQYAREKLLDSGEGSGIHDNHLRYFLEFAEKAAREIVVLPEVGPVVEEDID